MNRQVEEAAQAIADALRATPQPTAARWRWGTVEAVNSDGTMDVTVGGATMPSVRALTSALGATAGDRVRVDYLGTDAVVAGVRASGAAVERGDMTASSAISSMNSAPVRRRDGIATFTLAEANLAAALANGSSVLVGTLPEGFRPAGNVYAPCAVIANGSAYRNIYALIYYADAGTNAGRVYVYNRSGTSLAAGTPMSFTATYIVG